MKKSRNVSVPAKIKMALKGELESHVKTSSNSGQAGKRAVRGVTGNSGKQEKRAGYDVLAMFRIFSCGLSSIARSGISEVREGGWVLLALIHPGVLAKVEIQAKGEKYIISRVVTGAVVADMSAAVKKLKTKERRGEELRFLSIPAMHIMALWLHFPQHAQRDLFAPVSLNFAGLQKGSTYSRSTIETTLRRHATDLILHWYERNQRGASPEAAKNAPGNAPKRARRSRR